MHWFPTLLLWAAAFSRGASPAKPHHALIVAFDCEPRDSTGRVSAPGIIDKLKVARLDGYDFLVWHAPTDWDDLQAYLIATDSLDTRTWVTIVPPTEQQPPRGPTPPFGMNFTAWQLAISNLARQHSHLTGWVIDDFDLNSTFFTRERLAEMRAARASAGGAPTTLAIIYRRTLDSLSRWWSERAPYLDGVVYAYENYASVDSLGPQLRAARAALSRSAILGVNLYVKGGPRAPVHLRTLPYLRSALAVSDSLVDIVRLYCLPLEDARDSLFQEVSRYTTQRRLTTIPGAPPTRARVRSTPAAARQTPAL